MGARGRLMGANDRTFEGKSHFYKRTSFDAVILANAMALLCMLSGVRYRQDGERRRWPGSLISLNFIVFFSQYNKPVGIQSAVLIVKHRTAVTDGACPICEINTVKFFL